MERIAHNKFKRNEAVLRIQNGKYEVGIVSEITSSSPTNGAQQYDLFGHPVDTDDTVYTYGVRFCGGFVVEVLESDLKKISNDPIIVFPIDE